MICARKFVLLISFLFGFFVRALSTYSFILCTIFVLFIVLPPLFLSVKHFCSRLIWLSFLRDHFSILCLRVIFWFLLAFKAEKCFMNTPPVLHLVTWHFPVPAACCCHSAGAIFPIVKHDTLRIKNVIPRYLHDKYGSIKLYIKSTYRVDVFFTFFSVHVFLLLISL
jgi:hypothetical protein